MLIPAICKKDELTYEFDRLRYSDDLIFYNGCIEDGRIYIQGEDNSTLGCFQYAICDNEENVVGYLAYHIDYYSSSLFNVGLINFKKDKRSYMPIAGAVFKLIEEGKALNRVEFRAIEGNPAISFYDKAFNYFKDKGYVTRKLMLVEVFKDRKGKYHNDYIYEFVKDHTLELWGKF